MYLYTEQTSNFLCIKIGSESAGEFGPFVFVFSFYSHVPTVVLTHPSSTRSSVLYSPFLMTQT